jgi:hypothetical protein
MLFFPLTQFSFSHERRSRTSLRCPHLTFQNKPQINIPYNGIIVYYIVKLSSKPCQTNFSRGFSEYLTFVLLRDLLCEKKICLFICNKRVSSI